MPVPRVRAREGAGIYNTKNDQKQANPTKSTSNTHHNKTNHPTTTTKHTATTKPTRQLIIIIPTINNMRECETFHLQFETPMQDSYAEKIILRNCNSLTQSLHKNRILKYNIT